MNGSPRVNRNIFLEEDIVSTRFLLAVIVGFVIVILLGAGWAWLLYERETLRLGGLPEGSGMTAPRAIGGVSQTLIRVERHGQRLEAEQRLLLGEFGWVDRERGLVRIPIDEAIRLTAEEAGGE